MAALKVTFEIPATSGRLEDNIVNDWHFLTVAAPTTADTDTIAIALDAFYNGVTAPGTVALSAFLANQVSNTIKPTLRYYDVTAHLDGSPAGSPFLTRPAVNVITNNAANPPSIPAEVAICLTLKSAYGTDPEFGPIDPATGKKSRPRARDRNRIYIGPLNIDTCGQEAGIGDVRPASLVINALVGGAGGLVGLTTPSLAVWSRRAKTFDPCVGGWVDNAFDTQRRRGTDPNFRTTFGSQS